jgi:DNA-binding transcriptional LysR family regulator
MPQFSAYNRLLAIDSQVKTMTDSPQTKRISMRHLRAFVAVADYRSLTRASEALFVTQSALSLTIQHLEHDLGLAMFDRTTRRLDLTGAGHEFLPTARRLLRDFDGSISEMRALGKRERGKVGVAAVPSVMALLLSEASAAFIQSFPGIDLYLREDNSEGVQQRILSGDVDFGICSPLEPDAQLALQPLFEDTYGVVTASDHPLAQCVGEISWDQLDGHRIIGFSADLGMQHQLSKTPDLSAQVREPRYQVSNTATIATLLTRGAGVSVDGANDIENCCPFNPYWTLAVAGSDCDACRARKSTLFVTAVSRRTRAVSRVVGAA